MRKVLRDLALVEREVQLSDKAMTFLMRIRPYRTVDNVIDGVVITFIDISIRKKEDDRRALLMSELDHRVKNILAIISAVVRQTLVQSVSPDAFVDAIEGRIAAIARAHNLVTRAGGNHEVLLYDLAAAELAPYDLQDRKHFLSGPDVALTPRAGLALGMVIHELASNAVKFGSLSVPGGQITVEWQVADKASGNELKIVWTERGGPPVQPPAHAGFGTVLMDRSLAQEFDGAVDRKFSTSGLVCSITLPLTTDVGRSVRSSHGMEKGEGAQEKP